MKKLFVLASLLSVAPAVYSAASESAVPIDAKAAVDRLRSRARGKRDPRRPGFASPMS
jgi:hypothetical protein